MKVSMEVVLQAALFVEVFFLLLAIVWVIGHAIWVRRWLERRGQALSRGRRILHSVVEKRSVAGVSANDKAFLKSLPRRMRNRILLETATPLGPDELRWLRRVASDLGVVQEEADLLDSGQWSARLHASRLLQALGGGSEQIIELLHDPVPEIRAQAAEWAPAMESDDVLRALLGSLADSTGLCRFTVQDALVRMGRRVVPALDEFLRSQSDPRAIEGGLRVANRIADPGFAPTAERLTSHENDSVRARAAALLGALGGERSVQAVRMLLDDQSPNVRAAACRALGTLEDWESAGRLAALLRDRSFAVRREAGLALRAIGDPGTVLLRKYEKDDDRFASDMASQVLDLPEGVEGRL